MTKKMARLLKFLARIHDIGLNNAQYKALSSAGFQRQEADNLLLLASKEDRRLLAQHVPLSADELKGLANARDQRTRHALSVRLANQLSRLLNLEVNAVTPHTYSERQGPDVELALYGQRIRASLSGNQVKANGHSHHSCAYSAAGEYIPDRPSLVADLDAGVQGIAELLVSVAFSPMTIGSEKDGTLRKMDFDDICSRCSVSLSLEQKAAFLGNPRLRFEGLRSPHGLVIFSATILNSRWPELEQALLEKSYDSELIQYARMVMKSRWPQAEQVILDAVKKDAPYKLPRLPWGVAAYVTEIVKDRWPEMESVLPDSQKDDYAQALPCNLRRRFLKEAKATPAGAA